MVQVVAVVALGWDIQVKAVHQLQVKVLLAALAQVTLVHILAQVVAVLVRQVGLIQQQVLVLVELVYLPTHLGV